MMRRRTRPVRGPSRERPQRGSREKWNAKHADTGARRGRMPRLAFANEGERRAHQSAWRPCNEKYAKTDIQQTAATPYFAAGAIQLAEDQNASIAAAISSMHVTPYTSTIASRDAFTSD